MGHFLALQSYFPSVQAHLNGSVCYFLMSAIRHALELHLCNVTMDESAPHFGCTIVLCVTVKTGSVSNDGPSTSGKAVGLVASSIFPCCTGLEQFSWPLGRPIAQTSWAYCKQPKPNLHALCKPQGSSWITRSRIFQSTPPSKMFWRMSSHGDLMLAMAYFQQG